MMVYCPGLSTARLVSVYANLLAVDDEDEEDEMEDEEFIYDHDYPRRSASSV